MSDNHSQAAYSAWSEEAPPASETDPARRREMNRAALNAGLLAIDGVREEYLAQMVLVGQKYRQLSHLSGGTVERWRAALAAEFTPRFGIAPRPGAVADDPRTLRIAVDNMTAEVPANVPFLIGRMPGVHMLIGPAGTQRLSRVCVVLHYFPATNEVVIVDPGSISGYSLLKTGDPEAPLVSSTARARHRFTVLKADVTSVIRLAHRPECLLTVGPRECVVCMDRLRDVLFTTCGHFVACSACAARLTACPTCRRPIGDARIRYHGVMSCCN